MHEHLILRHSSVSLPLSEFLEDLKAPPVPFPAHILALRCLQRFVFVFTSEESYPSCHSPCCCITGFTVYHKHLQFQ